jgi:hypothetical protein
MFYIDIAGVMVTEKDLPLTDKELAKFEISREDLDRCFAEGRKLMAERGITESDRVRPVADQHQDGTWEVHLVGYSELSDPALSPLVRLHH